MKMFRRLSGRLFFAFAFGLTAVTLIFGFTGSHIIQELVVRGSANELRMLSLVLSQLIQRQFSYIEDSIAEMEESPPLIQELSKAYPDSPFLEKWLGEQLIKYPYFEELIIFATSGKCVGATDTYWYRINGKNHQFFKSGLREFGFPSIYDSDAANKVQLVSSPIVDSRSRTLGVIVGVVKLNSVYDLMEQELGLTDTRDAFLVDGELRFITPGKTGPEELVESHLVSTTLKAHLHDDFWVGDYLNYAGDRVLGTALKIPDYSWYIVVERQYDDVVKRIRNVRQGVYGVTFGLMVFFTLSSILVSRSISRPLLKLVQSARSIGAGRYHVPVPVPEGVEEVEVLAREFERMRQRVAQSQDSLRRKLETSEMLRIESERLAAIGSLASGMAHEIRNPLNAMNLLLARLSTNKSSDIRDQIMGDLFAEIGRLDNLVREVLDYAKPLGLNKSRENLNELASHIADFYRPLMEQRQVAFKVICDRDSLECHVDRDRIRQCLINLIQNALEAVPAGHGRIDLTIKKNGDDEAIIEVADNGSGISKDVQANLFNLFFTTKPQGTGIGLSTVQKIVNSHGGRIEVESEPSQGTRIRISLPIQDGEMS